MTSVPDNVAARIAHFESRLASDPAGRVFLPLAGLYHQTGRLDEARRLLEAGLEQHPDFVSARVALAGLLTVLAETDAARAEYDRVLERDPDNLVALRWLADNAVQNEDWPAAVAHGERLVRLLPEDTAAAERLGAARERAATAAAEPAADPEAPDSDEAGEVAEGAPADSAVSPTEDEEDREPANGLATLTLADLYLSQGHPDKARMILERIAQAHPGRPEVQERLAALETGIGGPVVGVEETSGAPADNPDAAPAPTGSARESEIEGEHAHRPTSAERKNDRARFAAWLERTGGQDGS